MACWSKRVFLSVTRFTQHGTLHCVPENGSEFDPTGDQKEAYCFPSSHQVLLRAYSVWGRGS